jgi:hypothetical protein
VPVAHQWVDAWLEVRSVDPHILDRIPFRVDLAELAKKMRLSQQSSAYEDLTRLAEEAEHVARPKAMYGIARVDSLGEESVVVNGTELTSRVLRVNLGSVQRVFPFAATCGTELEEWSQSVADHILYRFWADEIKEMALRTGLKVMGEHMASHYDPGKVSHMNPGSLADWPIRQQRPLFALLGDPEVAIGVRLTSSYLMVPIKSVSGIIFSTDTTFESCQLCPMERCPNRRAPYEKGLYGDKYRRQEALDLSDMGT